MKHVIDVLTGAIKGTSGFAERFAADGPRDSKGRSLRQLDLQQRLLRYPCSYLIYSSSFDGLPSEAKEYIYARLFQILTSADNAEEYSHLSRADRAAILEIIRQTKPDLPANWN